VPVKQMSSKDPEVKWQYENESVVIRMGKGR